MAAWACWGSQPGSSYRISLLLSGKVPGEAKMPSRIEGGPCRQGVGNSTCTRLCKRMSPGLCPSLITWLLILSQGHCKDPSDFCQ